MLRRYLSLALGLLLYTCAPAPLSAQGYVATAEDYARVLDAAFPADGPGATAIVVREGRTIYHAGHGLANVELDVPMDTQHVFRIGSITKQFTAMAILKLAEENRLELTDPLSKFLPDYPNGDRITVTHLLNHTSGVKSYTGMPEWDDETRRRDFTTSELVGFFQDRPADFAPGEQWSYNNSGYVLLGAIIEEVTGQSYADYLNETFFQPLGLGATYYDHTPRVIRNRVPGYTPGILGLQNAPYLSMTQPFAAGSLLSTVSDLSKWYHALVSGRVVTPASLDRALTPTTLNDGSTRDYGFGLVLGKDGDSPMFGHGGGVNGFATDSRYYPEEKLFVAVFSNSNGNSPNGPLNDLAQLALGRTDPGVATAPLTAEQVARFTGRYEIREGFILTLREKDGRLEAQATGQGAFLLDATGNPDVFTKSAYGIKITFNYDDKDRVESLTLAQNGDRVAEKI